ncbi:MAG: alanine racemase [Desulfobacterales bacterium]|jgi:alanine racemase|nr:alanine racemase [Desulfobacterales bacterium]
MSDSLVRATIDLSAIAHNARELRRITHPSARFMAVVKANAYGHGIVAVARTALMNGADALGVARIEEGMALRNAGIFAPILLFGALPPTRLDALIQYDITATIFSLQTARMLSRIGVSVGKKIRAHIKIDTGMGRLGLLPDSMRQGEEDPLNPRELISEITDITRMKGIDIEGIYTHFACADMPASTYTAKQFELFITLLYQLSTIGIDIPIKHAANSAAIIAHPETHLNMVRPGISLYGLYPSGEIDHDKILLKPAMALSSQIIQLNKVRSGFSISYGCTGQTQRDTLIATLPVGYADGLNRLLSNRGQMLVRGLRAPVVGRICMDLTMIDVGHIPGVDIGDEVVLFGQQGNETLSVDEIASTLNTIHYEIVIGISERVPRVYVNG